VPIHSRASVDVLGQAAGRATFKDRLHPTRVRPPNCLLAPCIGKFFRPTKSGEAASSFVRWRLQTLVPISEGHMNITKTVFRVTAYVLLGATISITSVYAADLPAGDSLQDNSTPPPQQFTPMTRQERLGHYVTGLVSVESIVTAAAGAGLSQATNTPKEWGGGAEAYGKRVGNVFAQHVIRNTLEYGVSAALHEDNRYFASGETGFLRRAKYAVMSTFLARHDNGNRFISFSRIGGSAGAAFIGREWQPPSKNSAGDGAVAFGLNMGTQAGFNVFREFWPDMKRRFHKD